jgi:nucleoside-diphosphate-sugar epimerase
MNRRDMLLSALALSCGAGRIRGEDFGTPRGAASAAGGAQPEAATAPATDAKPATLRTLILGGTGFIGPHFLREAQSRGHTVTLFNRGKTAPTPTPGVETLIGDRNGQLEALEGRDWDVVIDNSGFVPRQVRLTTRLLREHARHYLFISTVAVYADLSMPGASEDAPLKKLADETVEAVSRSTYGGLKALCERAVDEDFAGRNTILRPSFIVGPGDDTDRFTYWLWRMAQGGEMLAPGTPADPIQYVDVRDLARFVIDCVSAPRPGTFNVCTPPRYATIGEPARHGGADEGAVGRRGIPRRAGRARERRPADLAATLGRDRRGGAGEPGPRRSGGSAIRAARGHGARHLGLAARASRRGARSTRGRSLARGGGCIARALSRAMSAPRLALQVHHAPVFGMLLHGSSGERAPPFCSSSTEMLSGERTKAMRPSRGGRLIVTPWSIRRRQAA